MISEDQNSKKKLQDTSLNIKPSIPTYFNPQTQYVNKEI